MDLRCSVWLGLFGKFVSPSGADRQELTPGFCNAMRIQPKNAILAGLLGCFLLAYLCASVHLTTIEQDLVARTEAALRGIAVTKLKISANGRDIILTGNALTDKAAEQAGVAAVNVHGVFRVRNRLQVLDGEPVLPPATP